MQKKWNILFCSGIEDDCPVTRFMEDCEPAQQVKLIRMLSLLEENGPVLPRPYADILHDGIHELRVTLARSRVRILYFFCYETYIVLYHVFIKSRRRVPETYISKVMAYREQFLAKMSREQLERQAYAVF